MISVRKQVSKADLLSLRKQLVRTWNLSGLETSLRQKYPSEGQCSLEINARIGRVKSNVMSFVETNVHLGI